MQSYHTNLCNLRTISLAICMIHYSGYLFANSPRIFLDFRPGFGEIASILSVDRILPLIHHLHFPIRLSIHPIFRIHDPRGQRFLVSTRFAHRIVCRGFLSLFIIINLLLITLNEVFYAALSLHFHLISLPSASQTIIP